MRMTSKLQSSLLLLALTLSACTSPEAGTPLKVTIQNITSNQVLSGTMQVQVSVEGGTASNVTLYARDAQGADLPITSTSTQPYTLSFYTRNYPNQTPFQLFARAASGGKGNDSASIPVIIQNDGAPQLQYFVTLTYPKVGLTTQSGQSQPPLRPKVHPDKVRWTGKVERGKVMAQNTILPLSTASYVTDVEWGWKTVNNAYGYGIFLSETSNLGPFERIKNQAPGQQTLQGAVHNIPTLPGKRYSGAITQLIGTTETAMSNAISSPILQAQDAISPTSGTSITDGKPTLTWMKNPDADAYQYFVYNRNPELAPVTPIWTNDTTATTELSVFYPTSREPLSPGTYYWRVAGIQFRQGTPVAYSFSPVQSFRVP